MSALTVLVFYGRGHFEAPQEGFSAHEQVLVLTSASLSHLR